MSSRHEVTVHVTNELGLHLRAAGALAQLASQYPCEITLERDSIHANAKSIMSVLALGATRGTTLQLIATGERAEEAMTAVQALFARGFER